jgi:hypothetical protein
VAVVIATVIVSKNIIIITRLKRSQNKVKFKNHKRLQNNNNNQFRRKRNQLLRLLQLPQLFKLHQLLLKLQLQ